MLLWHPMKLFTVHTKLHGTETVSYTHLDVYKRQVDGAKAIQSSYAERDSQIWLLEETEEGYCHIVNKNSGKYLEVFSNSTEDGASVGQWGITDYGCQEWMLVKEGIH